MLDEGGGRIQAPPGGPARAEAEGGVRIVMLDDGGGRIQALPAGPARAEAEVGVLAVEKEPVVEAAYLVEHGAAVERGAAAGHEHFFGDGKVFGQAAAAALFARAIAGDQHAGGIEPVFAEETDLGGAH